MYMRIIKNCLNRRVDSFRALSFFLLLVFSLGDCPRALGSETDQTQVPKEKSVLLAGYLGIGVGFGTGHWYADGAWNPKATKWAIIDVATIGVWAWTSTQPYSFGNLLIGIMPFAIARIWQGVSAGVLASKGAGDQSLFEEERSALNLDSGVRRPVVWVPVFKTSF